MKKVKIIASSKETIATIKVNKFRAINNPTVCNTVSVIEILTAIKKGDKYLPFIQRARTYGKGSKEYVKIKEQYLPTVRFNFLFDGYALNSNIIAPTGLIYIDADNIDTIPDSEYIFAKWKSLSGLGYGILALVEGLTLENYRDTYNILSDLIGIEADAGGRKAAQQTVLSYDPELYFNEDSKVYVCKRVSPPTINIKKKGITTTDTFLDEGRIRFHNIGDFFTDDTPYKVFDEKVCICKPYIPRIIPEGKRNGTMFYILSQYAVLNPSKKDFLYGMAEQINKRMQPRLSKEEVNQVVRNVISARKRNILAMDCTEYRRILFNPQLTFSFQQKMEIVNSVLGDERSQKTKELIYQVLESWNFKNDGKITQKKVSMKAGLSISTVKRHWKNFEDYVLYLSK